MGSIKKSEKGKKGKRQYKGLAPLYIDRLLLFFLKIVFQLPIFIVFYIFFISKVNVSNTFEERLMEIGYIFIFLIVSDIIAHIIALGLDKYIIHKWGYLTHDNNRRHFIAFLTEYIIYVSLRTISYAFGLIWALTGWLYWQLPIGVNNYAFIIAWIIISLGSKFIAMLASFIILS